MSGEDKTLKETIAEELGGNNDTTIQASETKEGISAQDTTGETKSGDTHEYVSGIDISDIPEQDRPRIKELLGKKAKLLEDGYTGKFKEVATFKKAQEELQKRGISVEEASDVLKKHLDSKTLTQSDKNKVSKTLDKLISEAPYEQRSALEQMRQIIDEETDVKTIKKELNELKQSLGIYQQKAVQDRQVQLNTELDNLSAKYGSELISKYKDVITEKGLQYPNMAVSKILAFEVPIEEIEQAILLRGKKPLTKEKKEAISSNGSGITSASEKVDTKTKTFAEILLSGIKK